MEKNSDEKLFSGLAYLGMICCMIPSVAIYFIKREESEHIKFNSLQAIVLWLLLFVVDIGLNAVSWTLTAMVPSLGFIFSLVMLLPSLAIMGGWIYLLVMAFQGKDIEIPLVSDFIREKLMPI
ncbi:MAG: hypothetical protein K2X66_01005 [Cyanobacteria bacterium]|nr:hypothetical protein [Cyanobacteriota bacterium]